MSKKEKLTVVLIYLFCAFVLLELFVNYSAFRYLFPVKNINSYGYIHKKTNQVIIPLNRYSSRFKAQIALPFEWVKASLFAKQDLKPEFNEKNKKYGYVNSIGFVAIKHQFEEAFEFDSDYALVAIKAQDTLKYGVVDKLGRWIIEPNYTYLCPFKKYYTKACKDDKHCGIIDRFGNEITVMSYKIDKLSCDEFDCKDKFCAIGSKNNLSCKYFL